tara:strand:- start:207 stop:968 length:762 start_codon:yes stop_codon:yes gene_type:complete
VFSFNPPENFLANKTIMITGASDGIGKCCALRFAEYGANLILLGRSKEKLEELYDLIKPVGLGDVVIHPLDFIKAAESDYAQIAKSVGVQFGKLDGLIHNAGMLGTLCPIEYYPTETWEQTFKVNTSAVFLLTKFLLPFLRSSTDARILITSSSVGRKGRGNWGAYAVSKFAGEGLMQVLAEELDRTSNIRVNSINPGGIRSSMRRSAYPAENPAKNPPPDVLIPLYLYLFSLESKDIHGEALDFKDFDSSKY